MIIDVSKQQIRVSENEVYEIAKRVRQLCDKYADEYYKSDLRGGGCFYEVGQIGTCPLCGCVVGIALQQMGAVPSELAAATHYISASKGVGTLLVREDGTDWPGVKYWLGLDRTPPTDDDPATRASHALYWAAVAQSGQDSRARLGAVKQSADEKLKSLQLDVCDFLDQMDDFDIG
jgi:hypothetical protein